MYTDDNGKVNPGFTVVADNLPGLMQYLDLVRDCVEMFDLPKLPPNDVQHAHVFDGTIGRSFKYAACDNAWNRKHRQTSGPGGPVSGSDSGDASDDNTKDADEDGSDEDDADNVDEDEEA